MATRAIDKPPEIWPVVMHREGWFWRKGWKAALVVAAFLIVAIAGWWAWQDVAIKKTTLAHQEVFGSFAR
jgi:hypothetical protein